MKAKKWIALALAGCLTLALTACGSGPSVYVQSVGQLMNYGGIAPGDRFGGMVVSEFVAEVEKDGDRTIAELLVKEGDDVKEGQALFSYDTEELQLTLDKQRLELEQMKSSIDTYHEQISQLEAERNRVGGTDKLQFTVQIQTTQLDLKETELKIKTKEAEVKKSEAILEHAEVVSPVTGRVQAISEGGTDQNGEPMPYITIQKSGAYRIKGILGELQRGSISEGTRIRILSRTDPDASWTGTVSLVDFENPIKSHNQGMGGMQDEMTQASKYPFYVKLDSTEGLIMGQHVYMELDSGEGDAFAVAVDASFLIMEEDGSSFVWAENRHGKLEKRAVTLGEYNEISNLYEVLEGLTKDDYIAFPDETLCREGIRTSHEPVAVEEEENMMPDEGIMDDGAMLPDPGMMPDMGMLPEEDLSAEEELLPEQEALPEENVEMEEVLPEGEALSGEPGQPAESGE